MGVGSPFTSRHGLVRVAAVGVTAVASLGLVATHAGAVSGGGYDPGKQHCTSDADRNDRTAAQPGCHNSTAQVNDGAWQIASASTDQSAQGDLVHSGEITVDLGPGLAFRLTWDDGVETLRSHDKPGVGVHRQKSQGGVRHLRIKQLGIYFGADDNLNQGEHDGVNPSGHGGADGRVSHGPSDGGAIQANVHPQGRLRHPRTLLLNVNPWDSHNPVRAADAATGACADGICFGADTMRRTDYQGGCGSCPAQPVYDDNRSTGWRSPKCNSGDTGSQDECGSGWRNGNDEGGISQPYNERGGYYSDPGVFIYEDPDPQSSPALPIYPMCDTYVGTQGVIICNHHLVPVRGSGGGGGQPGSAGTPGTVAPVSPPLSAPAVDAAPGAATAPMTTPAVPAAPSTPGLAGTVAPVASGLAGAAASVTTAPPLAAAPPRAPAVLPAPAEPR